MYAFSLVNLSFSTGVPVEYLERLKGKTFFLSYDSYPNKDKVTSHCGFGLYFPGNQ